MGATAAQILQLRRMVAEPTDATYDDELLAAYVERYPLLDERGQEPYTWNTSTRPPTQSENEDWIPTYDLHAAAGDVWEEKAAGLAAKTDFSADGANVSLSQQHMHALAQARYHRSRRSPKSGTLIKWPREVDTSYVVNRLRRP